MVKSQPRLKSLTLMIAVTAMVGSVISGKSEAGGPQLGIAGGVGLGYMSTMGNEFDKFKVCGGVRVNARLNNRLRARTGVFWEPKGTGLVSGIPEVTSSAVRTKLHNDSRRSELATAFQAFIPKLWVGNGLSS
jgi:hypothetical protein